MSTSFGKTYADAIKANSNNKKGKVARQQAYLAYKEAKNKYDEEKPIRLKKKQEEQTELEKTRPERIKAKKEHKLAKNKARREKQKLTKEVANKEEVQKTVIKEEKPVEPPVEKVEKKGEISNG